MQEKYWQQLKSQICPKDLWVPDEHATKCSCCGKEFKFLIRRKHHCRFCGKIFCSDCSNFFLNGNYIGIPDEKFVRNCEFCHHRIQKFIRDCSKYPQLQKSPEKQWSEKSDDGQREDSLKQNNIFADSQPISSIEASMKVEEQIKQFLLAASQYLCLKFEIDNKFWAQRLADVSLRAALETKMDIMIQNQDENTMDIAKKVRICAITTPENEVSCVVFKGITIQKNLYLKSMPRHLSKPKIIIVANSIDADSLVSFIKFEQIIKNQKQIMRKLLDKVFKKIQPDVVFVENSICITAFQYFKQKKIIAFSKIKPKDIQAIMCVAKIKRKIKELWMIERYNNHNIIGTCDKIYFKNIRQQQSLMFMQGDMGIRTIIIGQSTEERTLILKKCLKNLIRFARQMQLEKYIIDTDLQMRNLLIKNQPKCQFPFIQSFTPFMQRSIQSCLSKQQSIFTHITYSLIKLINAPKNYIQYAQHQSKASMREVCGKIQYQKKKLYTTSDITLGSFILLTAANSEKNCKKCEYTHCQSFYMHGLEIRIQIERRQSMKVPSIMDDLPDNEAVTFQKLRYFLLKQKQLVVITTYLQCSLCRTNLINQSIKIGRNYLQNSLYNFFENISQFYIAQQIRISQLRQSKKKKIRKLSMNCQHEQLTRCFEYNNTLVKFVVEKTIQYSLNHIDIQSSQSIAEIAQYDDKFIQNLYFMQLMQKKQIYEKILVIFNTLPFPCNNNNITISTKAMFCYPQFIKAKEIIEQSRSQLKTIQSRSLKYLENSGHDWTIFMRQIYKIEQLYRTAIDLLNEFELILKKQRVQEMKQLEPIQSLKNKSVSLNYSASQSTNINQNNITQTFENKQKLNQTSRGNNQQNYRKDSEDTTITTFYKNLNKRRYPRNQGSCLYFTPIYTQDAVSIIAAGLNSVELKKNLNAETPIPNQLKLRIPFNRKLKTSWELKKQLETIYQQIFTQAPQKQMKYDAYDLTIFYHKQFEQLRQRQGISFDLYIRSLCGCRNWDSSGGKSNSKFAKSHNELLVVKIINAKQFVEFQRFCPSYLEYIRQSKDRKQQSYIARIYGIYEVTIKNKNYKCIVMQNIFFGMGSQTKVYDLKGSEVNRLNMPPNYTELKNITGQDTNFKIDRDGQPIILEPNQYDRTIKILQSDAKFLKDMAVIDYSLLLIISGKSIRIGIIDFMRPYQFIEKVETFYKQLRSGRQPTVIPPQNYAERFIIAMRKYFIKVQSLEFI